MSIERLQAAIREKKTPVALGLAPEIDKVPVKILKNFEDMFGPGMMANAEALRFHGCQAMDAAQGKLPAVVISAEHYLRYGMMGADVLSNLTGAASARGLYAIVDCRTTRPELWLTSPMAGDGFTVMPYVGGDCVPESTDKGIFAVVRTANERSGEVQNLIAGDRPLYAAVAQQMARRGAALVVETGMRTEMGKIAALLENEGETVTPLQRKLAQLGKYLGILALVICAVIFVVGLLDGLDPLDMFMTAVSLAVAAIPEGLPAIVTMLLRLAALCTDGTVREENGTEIPVGDPTETAIVACALHHGLRKEELTAEHPRVGEIPFDSDRKLMTTVHLIEGKTVAIVKGAPDILLNRCTAGKLQEAAAANEEMGRQALRVLAIGYKYLDEVPVDCRPEELEQGLTFAGLVGMIDPPRPEAMEAIKVCDGAGIRTVMITGDHVITASAIARQLGILHSDDEAVTGEQLAAMSDEELRAGIRKFRVYARVTPADKIRIVKAWQEAGEIVSMTGDGVNDAPALKAADIGCAMGLSGTDVAKGAAEMILTDDNFSTIVQAVEEGRGIYSNIRKAIHYLLSCNIGEIFTIFVATLLNFGQMPLVPVQLLWLNLVTDSLPALALGVEPVEEGVMDQPPRDPSAGLFSRGFSLRLAWQGLMVGGLTLGAYLLGLFHLGAPGMEGAAANTMAFATLTLSQLFHAFNVRSEDQSLLAQGALSNPAMNKAFLAGMVMQLSVLLLPPLQGVFSVCPMDLTQWVTVLALAMAPIPICEAEKALRRRRPEAEEPRQEKELSAARK